MARPLSPSATPAPRAADRRAVAYDLLRRGQVRDACAAFETLLGQDDSLPDDWFNYAYLLRADRQFEAALDAYTTSIARGVQQPEAALLNAAVIEADFLRRFDAAAHRLHAALALQPDYVPALLNLGLLHEDRGDADAARACYDRVIGIAPHNGRALARLAELARVRGRATPAATALEAALASTAMPPIDRAQALFALAQLYDAQGDYPRALDAAVAANAITAALRPASARYSSARQRGYVERCIAAFSQPILPHPPETRPAPIFICGMFRSGSTLLETLLARHYRVVAGGELEIIPFFAQRRFADYPDDVPMLDATRLVALRTAYLAEADLRVGPQRPITDKRPDNIQHIGVIKTLFPAAQIIATQRDARDTMISILFGDFDDSIAYANRVDTIADYMQSSARLRDFWMERYPADIAQIRYEDLVATPTHALQRLADHIGLEGRAPSEAASTTDIATQTLSTWHVRQPVHQASVGRWRHYWDLMRAQPDQFDPEALDHLDTMATRGGARDG